MDSNDIENYFGSHKSILALLLLIVGVVSVSGFFMGMRQSMTDETDSSPWRSAETPNERLQGIYPEAPLYKDIPSTKWKANKNWKNNLANLPRKQLELTPQEPLNESERAKVLAERAARRAYDGAPPTIPHAINYRDVQSCVVCHNQDANVLVGGIRTPAMSHHYMSSCTQCHALSEGLSIVVRSGTTGLVVENKFDGNKSSGKGSRAFEGAPPTIPHRIWLRQNCSSCHGVGMPDAIVTPHPQRSNCLQCHAQNASYDNREGVTLLTPSKSQ